MQFKKWLIVAASLFIFGILLGLVASPDLISNELTELEETSSGLAGWPAFAVFVFIFVKNTFALLSSFILAPILCISAVLSLVLNGWLISVVGAAVVEQESFGFLFAGILPHGIFEIPALIIGGAAALSFGMSCIIGLFNKTKRAGIIPNFQMNLRYMGVALILLFPAALIEAFITPKFLD